MCVRPGSAYLIAVVVAVAVWQDALLLVAHGSPVGVTVHVWEGRATVVRRERTIGKKEKKLNPAMRSKE